MSWRPSAWFAVEALSASLTQLALGAWMIQANGLAAYGEWAWALALLNLAAVAAFAMTPGLALQVQAEEHAGEARGWLVAAATVSVPLALAVLALATAVAGHALGAGVFAALALHVCVNALSLLAAAALHGRGMQARAALVTLALRVTAALAVGTAAWAGVPLAGLVLVSALAGALQALVLCAPLWRGEPADLAVRATLRPRGMTLLRLARWQWMKSAGGLLFGAGDRVLVGHLLGPSALAVYSVCAMLAEPLTRLASILTQPLLLWAGRLRARGDTLGVHVRGFVAIEASILVVAAAAALVVPWLLPLWFGVEAANHAAVLRLAIAAATLAALHPVVSYVLAGSGRQRDLAWASLLGGAATLAAMALAAPAGLQAMVACRLLYGIAQFAGWPALLRLARNPSPPSPSRRGFQA